MKKILLLMLVVMGVEMAHAQQDKDTISYPDGRYYHPPLDTSGYLFIEPEDDVIANYYAAPGYLGNIQYVAIQPLRIYGIAVTSRHEGPLFFRTYYNSTQYSPIPPDVDSSTVDLYAVLVQKEGPDSCVARHVDSVKWHPRPPDRYYYYEARQPANTLNPPYYYAPVYEFYFDTPRVVMDTFYVGFRSDYVMPPEFDPLLHHDSEWVRYYPQQWVWSIMYLFGTSITNGRNEYVEGWRRTAISSCIEKTPYAWGGIFPILVPPDTDAVVGLPVWGFHRGEDYEGWPVFEWSQTEGQELYEVAYGRADQDPHDFRVVRTTYPWLILRDSTLDSTVVYAAQCRSRRHHACAIHDTLVWSAWTDTVEFYTGRYRPGSAPTEGIAEVVGGTAFTLSPNPAKDGVRLEVAAEGFRGGVLAVSDAAGREVLRRELKASERVCEFRVADLPAGTYFVTLATKDGTSTRKLVVE